MLHFLRAERAAQDGALAVGEPFLEDLVAAEAVVPDGGGDVAPEGVGVELDFEGGLAEGGASPMAARSSGVKRRSTKRPCPGITASPWPKCPQPAVSAKSTPAILRPSMVEGTAMAAMSWRSGAWVTPGTSASGSSSAATSGPQPRLVGIESNKLPGQCGGQLCSGQYSSVAAASMESPISLPQGYDAGELPDAPRLSDGEYALFPEVVPHARL